MAVPCQDTRTAWSAGAGTSPELLGHRCVRRAAAKGGDCPALIHEQEGAGILVTHDVNICRFVDRVLQLHDGKLSEEHTTQKEIAALPNGATRSLIERCRGSGGFEVALDLEIGHMHSVIIPFLALGADKSLVGHFAERRLDHVVLFQVVQGIV